MSQPTTARPFQVTVAGTVVLVGSILIVMTAWTRLAAVRSLETREGIERFLAGPPGEGLGLTVEEAIGFLHVATLVAAGCAAATAILGWYVLRRDTKARLALSVLAVPLLVAGVFVDPLTPSFVAAATTMLWLSPAREWFATGSWTPPQPRQSQARQAQALGDQDRPASWPPPSSTSVGGNPAERPTGQHPGAHQEPPPQGRPFGSTMAPPYAPSPAHPHPWGPASEERPRSVVTAAVLTIVMSVLVAAMALLSLALVGTSSELLLEEMARQEPELAQDVTAAQLRTGTYVIGGACLLLCALAVTFAGFVLAGRDWARWALMVTAAFTMGTCLILAVVPGGLPALVPAFAAMVTVVLLRRPESRAWCQRGSAPRG